MERRSSTAPALLLTRSRRRCSRTTWKTSHTRKRDTRKTGQPPYVYPGMLSRGYRAAVGRVHPHPTCCIHPSTVRETTWNLAEKHRRTSAETTTRNAVAIVARERGEPMKPLRGNARPGFRDSATSAAMKPQGLKLELRRACERPHRGSRFVPLRVIPRVPAAVVWFDVSCSRFNLVRDCRSRSRSCVVVRFACVRCDAVVCERRSRCRS